MISKPKYKIARRLGPIYEKTQTQRFTLSEARRAKAAGRGKRPKALSDYGLQLIEKQKIKFSYGISERQFGKYVEEAMKSIAVAPSIKLQESLESRLDNVAYRIGLAPTRASARQMVAHGHLLINGKRTTSPSYRVKIGDKIGIREGSKNKGIFQELAKKLKNYKSPEWLRFDPNTFAGEVENKPKALDGAFNFDTVLEFYSR